VSFQQEYNPEDFVKGPDNEGIREFHLGDILSITKRWVVSPRGSFGVLDVLSYMTGDTVWVHQVPRIGEECLPELERQHPDLDIIESPRGLQTNEEIAAWIGPILVKYGEYRRVLPLHPDQHTSIDGVEELISWGAAEKIIHADVNNPAQAIEDIRRVRGNT